MNRSNDDDYSERDWLSPGGGRFTPVARMPMNRKTTHFCLAVRPPASGPKEESRTMNMEVIAQWMNTVLVWIGFGTVVGLIAKAVLPGRDNGGALATVIIGILGSVIGAALLSFFVEGAHVTPISLLGFFVALGGTTLLLISYRLIGGGSGMWGLWSRYRGPRRGATTIIEKV